MNILIITSAIFFVISIILNPRSKILKNNHKILKIIVCVVSLIISGVSFSIAEYMCLIPECQNLKIYVPLLLLSISNALGCSFIIGEVIDSIIAKIKNREVW